jgi:putative peptide zinc metalloprotease protein
VASAVYRVFISMAILLFVADKLFILGSILAIAAVIAWVFVPLGKFARYLFTSGELARVRPRAMATTLLVLAALLVGVGLISAPDRCRAEGQVWPTSYAEVYAAADGFLEDYLPSGRAVSPGGPPLVKAVNPELSAQREELLAEKRQLEARRRLAGLEEVAAAQILAEQIQAVQEQIQRVEEQLASLALQPPMAGTWVSPDIEKFSGAYLRRGERVGLVASLDKSIIRAVAGQDIASLIVGSAGPHVEVRLEGRPESEFTGTVVRILPAGQQYLPSPALGYAAGGATETAQDDSRGLKAAERVFEIHIVPDADCQVRLLSGQRVVVRFQMPSKPLAAQGWRWLLQLIQRRFHI